MINEVDADGTGTIDSVQLPGPGRAGMPMLEGDVNWLLRVGPFVHQVKRYTFRASAGTSSIAKDSSDVLEAAEGERRRQGEKEDDAPEALRVELSERERRRQGKL
mmetsp:Transcript_172560/g.553183  ORF Transcript_172560/g.553183 Transcript_172560/m.553183 type:complete len:105 (+) Transcript_172560:2-316(+)